jgi:protein-disulfide isomerase
MQKKTIFISAAALTLAVLGLIAWWYLAAQAVPAAAQTSVDTTALVRPHAPSEGPTDAPVVIVEFFDPACGTCRTFYPLVKQLMAEQPGRIRLVLRYAPFHKGSDKVVAVLAAAQRQGKFWPVLEALLDSQDDWAANHTAKVERVWPHLEGLGLNLEQLAFDMTAPELQQALEQDLRDANTLGVTQTPEYFVNAKPLPEFGFAQLQALVKSELARTR